MIQSFENFIGNQLRISIIIPIYNMSSYIKECLDSIINQTFKEIEIICVDDCSTDNSAEIIKSYKDHRIKYVTTIKNSGPAIAKNIGINKSSSEFIIFMDPDDYYYNHRVLETLYNNAKIHNVNIIAGNLMVYCTKNNTKEPFIDHTYFHENKFYSFKQNYYSSFNYTRFMFKRDLILKNSLLFPDYLRREDPVFLLNTMIKNDIFYAINDIIYVYRVNHKQVNWSFQKKKDYISSCKENLSICKENNMPKHYLWEFLEFKQSVLLENLFKIDDDINDHIQEVKRSIYYPFIKSSISSKIQDHEKCYINNLLNIISSYSNNKIVIYGFGNIGIDLYEKIKIHGNVKCIIDNNLYGINVDNLKISKDTDLDSFDDCIIILTVYNEYNKKQLINKLLQDGFKKNQIVYA